MLNSFTIQIIPKIVPINLYFLLFFKGNGEVQIIFVW